MDTPPDLTILLASLTGLDLATIGRWLGYLITIVALRTVLHGPLTSGLELAREVLDGWRIRARVTRTTIDDHLVRLASYLLEGWALVLTLLTLAAQLLAWMTPRFALGLQVAEQQAATRRRPPPLPLLGLLMWVLLAGGALAVTGCARGSSDTTPLHRASAGASVFADAGTFAGAELARHIEADLAEVRAACVADQDGRDCDAAVRYRATEYQVIIAGHTLYAQLVNQLVDELESQARRKAAGEAVDLGDAIRLSGRVLTAYRSLAETLRIIGLDAPPIPVSAIAALEDLR